MNRSAVALASVALPTLVLALLLAVEQRNWLDCFAATQGQTSSLPVRPSTGLPDVFAATLFATPLRPFWLAAPFALFALLVFVARSRATRRVIVLGETLFLGAIVVWFWPASPAQACTLPAPDPFQSAARLLPAGILAALLANKINCLAGACRK